MSRRPWKCQLQGMGGGGGGGTSKIQSCGPQCHLMDRFGLEAALVVGGHLGRSNLGGN